MKKIKITKKLALKIKEVVSCGLSSGLGIPQPGKMCVEAAVNYACGLPHGDNPSCVGYAVRAFKIALNDAKWSSNEVRAKGMIKIAIAQLGSDEIDQKKFVELLAIKTVNKSLSKLMKEIKLNKEAENCKNAATLSAARLAAESAARSVWSARLAAESAAESAARSAARLAAMSARSARSAAMSAARLAAESAAESAARSAARSARSARLAARLAAMSARLADQKLIDAADICLECLVELKSPGCKYLYLLDK